ncbi:PEBP-like protein [Backusella circina FSU 941]|nr:PEBP-like protein [Backusella circina FSU 941]
MPLVTMEMGLDCALKSAGISPNIVPEGFSPSTLLDIKYPSGEDVALGNFIKPEDSAQQPTVNFIPDDENSHYTLVLIDPDAPTRDDPKMSPYRHWVVCNIPGSSNFVQATEISSYMGPAPPPGTGDHRYIYLLYKQPSAGASAQVLSKNRGCWAHDAYVKESKLELVSVNFFISKKD